MKTIIFAMLLVVMAISANAQTIEQYVSDHYQLAKKVDSLFGIPASICLAQAIASGYGTSPMAKHNNHFGYTPKEYQSVKDCYLAYGNDISEAIGAHGQNLTVEQWAEMLQNLPMFNELGYSNTLLEIIYTHNLKKYDSQGL